ncbi:interleukin-1 beta-like isoform X1 [Thamnophis elegans]|uniref:interleukin-1 beta-like isoform X1 n=2 Tax=Thamnophis elegans TaxID=35005 RepID=UPI001376F664|nr:interleukin-1 beta-like isoform X1 [Thamnophis elegans]
MLLSISRMQFCAADQPYPSKDTFQVSEMDVQVAVTKNEPKKSFRKAVLIVIASESMKKSPTRLFSDEDLMDILSTILEPVTFDIYGCTEATDSTYHLRKNIIYDIKDSDHKSFVFKEPAQLVAMHLQGPNIEQAVKLKMSMYRPKDEAGTLKVPVALSIQKGKLYISCKKKEGQLPVLQLEEATLQGNLDKSQLGRFLFYKIDIGKYTRFESAECPGWYICTSTQSEEAVAVTQEIGGPRIVNYSLISQ